MIDPSTWKLEAWKAQVGKEKNKMNWWTHYYIVLVVVLVGTLVMVGMAYREFARKLKEK